jgi:hypothetical protein
MADSNDFDVGARTRKCWHTRVSITGNKKERLIDIVRVVPDATGAEGGYVNVTQLGIDFVRDCTPDADAVTA